ncbi:hypothetical protein Ciccas_001852 [Cichlidogyrus casuarinus]|uniref:J domain-containing protein n=1 Tax=Cichlidogyrus casuarinus TaxID=1844966 RepID=A0ABD2QIW9_9PLAT
MLSLLIPLERSVPTQAIVQFLQSMLPSCIKSTFPSVFSMKDPDYYAILGVPKTATPEEIKKAYRMKALKCHPDKFANDPEKTQEFQLLNEANKVLSDPRIRKIYDSMGMMGVKMARELGTEYAEMLIQFSSPCAKFCILCLFCLTGCCCCCCCCCCCNFCCGKYANKHPEEDYDADVFSEEVSIVTYRCIEIDRPSFYSSTGDIYLKACLRIFFNLMIDNCKQEEEAKAVKTDDEKKSLFAGDASPRPDDQVCFSL